MLDQPGSVHSNEAINVAQQVLDESSAVFTDINSMLDRVRTKRQDGTISPSVPQRIRWCFKKNSIEYLLGRMDRLQMSLSLMLQIIQLGSTMASTSRHDPPERVKEMSDKIRRERVEAQNVVVLYLFENQHLDQLYQVARGEVTESQSPLEYLDESVDLTLVSTNDTQLTKVEDVTLQSMKDLMVKPPKNVLPDFDDDWYRMAESKEDMLTVSDRVIDKLLDRWTVWRKRRDQELRQPQSRHNGRYRSAVDDAHDDEDASHFFERFQDRDDSPTSKLLEGLTTDWRQPHSAQARMEKHRLQKSYAGYQPSVSEPGSDVEDSPSSTSSRKRPSKRHVIDSDPESSEDESEQLGEKPSEKPPQPRRRSSSIVFPSAEKSRPSDGFPMSKSFNAPSLRPVVRSGSSNDRSPASPTWLQYQQQTHQQYQKRPLPVPDQNKYHHSFSSPIPNVQTQYNGGYPVQPYIPGPQSPSSCLPPIQQMHPFTPAQSQTPLAPPRYPPRLSPQTTRSAQALQRPNSRDGKPPRSPSRLSREYQRNLELRYRQEEGEERRQIKRERRSKFGDNAVKGLLAGGGLAVFLEALEALDL